MVEENRKEHSREQVATRVSLVSIVVNVILSVGKLAAGLLGHSAAMVSDAVHSASDVFTTLIVIVGIRVSSKKSDEEHQYGHERLECVASIILATILALTGLGIGIGGIGQIVNRDTVPLAVPTALPLVAAVVSIVTKELMYWYTRHYALSLNSDALMADAWHHRSDALSSVGSLLGIGGARMGYPVLDPLASLVICILILKAAYDIFKGAIDKMVDRSCDPELEEEMKDIIERVPGVDHVDLLRTRLFGSRIYVDVEISADDTLTLIESHRIAEQIHHEIEVRFPDVKHCMVHMNPLSEWKHDF
ncbi:MAG: cation diffusion facilitator family transporter [Succiniclasticum sp.]